MRLALDFDVAEDELPSVATDVEACFDAEWTRALLASAVASLEASCRERGKNVVFAVFRRYVLDDEVGDGPSSDTAHAENGDATKRPSYAVLARELGISVSDVTNHLSWARREFRRLALESLREITATEEEFRSEAQALFGVDA
jgi:hypothetical protein